MKTSQLQKECMKRYYEANKERLQAYGREHRKKYYQENREQCINATMNSPSHKSLKHKEVNNELTKKRYFFMKECNRLNGILC